MSSRSEPIKATIGVDVKPWIVPNYVTPTERDGSNIHVAQLSDGALDTMAQDFVNRLYENAGRKPPVLRKQ